MVLSWTDSLEAMQSSSILTDDGQRFQSMANATSVKDYCTRS